jgi:hypothetical protein
MGGGLGLGMTNEQNPAFEIQSYVLPGVAVQLWADINGRFPVGYQDETGFHYGIEPVMPLLEEVAPLSEAKPISS